MLNSNLPESELLKALLEPLLEIPILSDEDQSDLLARVKQAQQEVGAAKALFQATVGQVGIETTALMPWHRLLAECWQVSARFRSLQSAPPGN